MSKVKLLDVNNILSDLAFTYSKNPNNQILEDTLRAAAIIVQVEYKQKGDWYNALVVSIFGYLQETDGSVPYDKMAEELANRIIGIEPDWDSIDNLGLSVRTYVCLKRVGISTVSQLRNMYTDELRKLTNLNQQSIAEIADKLEKYEF